MLLDRYGRMQPDSKPDKDMWVWQNRPRCWIFGLGDELLLAGMTGTLPQIEDGERYTVWSVFPAGQEIPPGESDRVPDQLKMDAAEFHFCMELTESDLMDETKKTKGKGVAPEYGFWMVPKSDSAAATGEEYRVCYAVRPKTPIVDIMALRGRLGRPDRARFFASIKSYRMNPLKKLVGDGVN